MNHPRLKIGPKNVILILSAIFIVAGAFILAERRNSQTEKVVYTAEISTVTDTIPYQFQNEDSDKDGLKDWEEILLGTNPHNPDTDGDGTSDGKESASGRNPLVKGPKDTSTVSSSILTSENLSPTDKLARDFFARYMELKQVGLSQDQQSQQELVNQVLKSGTIITTPKIYNLKNILTIPDNSMEAVKKYGNEIGAVFQKYSLPNARNEVVIAKESVDGENSTILKEIDPIISSYKNINTSLLKIKVPQSISTIHLDLINNISILIFSAESLRKIDKDALSGIQGATLYVKGASGLNASFNDIKSSFSTNGIIYSSGEPGRFFIPQQS